MNVDQIAKCLFALTKAFLMPTTTHSEANSSKCKRVFDNSDPSIHRQAKQTTVPTSEGQVTRIPCTGGSVGTLKTK